MKTSEILFLVFVLITVSACKSTTLDYSVSIDVPIIVDAIEPDSPQLKAREKIKAFERAGYETVKGPYLEIVQKVEALPEDQSCTQSSQLLYARASKLNPSSIYFKYLLLNCREDSIDIVEYENALDEISELALIILETGSGETIETAIKVREVAEATVIMQLAGLTELDSEVIVQNGNFYYKLHIYDNVNEKSVYRYISNFEFVKSIYSSVLLKPINDRALTEQFILELSQQRAPISMPFILKGLAHTNEHQTIVSEANTYNTSPLTSVLIAESALVTLDDVLLDSLLDTLVVYAEQGLIEAHNVITLFLFIKDAEHSWVTIQGRLKEADERSTAGMGIDLLLNSLLRRPDYQLQLKKFIDLTANSVNNYLNLPQLLKETSDFSAYLQSETNNSIFNFYQQIQETNLLLAELGDSRAKHQSAMHIFKQNNPNEQELALAQLYLKAAANEGYSDALLDLGLYHGTGKYGFTEDQDKELDYYLQSAALNNQYAFFNLGLIYRNGEQVTANAQLALDYFQKSIDGGYYPSYCEKGNTLKDYVSTPNFELAKQAYEQGIDALKGEKEAARCFTGLALIYQFEDKHIKKAIEAFDSAVLLGSGFAAYKLANLFDFSDDNFQDYNKARDYYQKAIDLNYPKAAANLGFIYEDGKGDIEKDNKKALEYYQLGTQYNFAQAMNNLGTFYLRGIEIEKDVQKAIELYKNAADLGNNFALTNYGDLLWEGEHLEQNHS
jgi:TPR repeat protein